jgi:hypothetical protein
VLAFWSDRRRAAVEAPLRLLSWTTSPSSMPGITAGRKKACYQIFLYDCFVRRFRQHNGPGAVTPHEEDGYPRVREWRVEYQVHRMSDGDLLNSVAATGRRSSLTTDLPTASPPASAHHQCASRSTCPPPSPKHRYRSCPADVRCGPAASWHHGSRCRAVRRFPG